MRHQLSLNRLFELEERPVSLPGQGGYWRVNLSAPPGTKRPRKRGAQDRMDAPAGVQDAPTVFAGDHRRYEQLAATNLRWADHNVLAPVMRLGEHAQLGAYGAAGTAMEEVGALQSITALDGELRRGGRSDRFMVPSAYGPMPSIQEHRSSIHD